jgi:hypothetical protein
MGKTSRSTSVDGGAATSTSHHHHHHHPPRGGALVAECSTAATSSPEHHKLQHFASAKIRVGSQYQTKVPKYNGDDDEDVTFDRPKPDLMSNEYPNCTQQDHEKAIASLNNEQQHLGEECFGGPGSTRGEAVERRVIRWLRLISCITIWSIFIKRPIFSFGLPFQAENLLMEGIL